MELTTPELLKKIKRIQLKSQWLSKQQFAGDYRSAFKGKGMSFSEVREYQYGDDIKLIDWNVTARLGNPHVKIFEEEKEITIMLLIDVSHSCLFGSYQQTKLDLITELCATLAFSAIQNNDRVGVIFFDSQVRQFIPPKKGKMHVLHIIQNLLEYANNYLKNNTLENKKTNTKQPNTHTITDLNSVLKFFNKTLKKKCTAFLISDFITEPNYEKSVAATAKHHTLMAIHVYDDTEIALPNIGIVPIINPETQAIQWVDTSSKTLKKELLVLFSKNYETCKKIFIKNKCNILHLATNQNYTTPLIYFFRKNQKN